MRNLLTLLLALSFQLAIAQEMDWTKVDDQLIEEISAQPDAYHSFFILLSDQVDVLTEKARFDQTNASLQERTYRLLTLLQEKARTGQVDLLQLLNNSDQIATSSIKPYWITNTIYVQGTKEIMTTLSQRSDVAFLEAELEAKIVDHNEKATTAPMEQDGREPGLTAINAHKLWEMGYSGYGQIALIVDTGTEAKHPALRNNYLGEYFDQSQTFNGNGEEPTDCNGHGTHVAGTICGLNRLANDTIGVAFNAQWIAGPVNLTGGCEDIVNTPNNFLDNFEWALDPDGNPATISDMPAAINNSWGSGSSGCNNNGGLANSLSALEAVGVAVIWAAGNDGPGVSTILVQSNVNNSLVNTFAVGAVNGNSADLPIANFSSRGPSTCPSSGSLLIKPEVSAPGVNVRSAYPGGGYRFLQGTSMASPHAAGAVVLLKEAFPYLTGEEIKRALYFSATDLGEPGEDNTYGMGIINLLSAFNYLVDQGHTPADPHKEIDALLVDFDAESLNCNGQSTWGVTFENGGSEPLTNLTINYQILYHLGEIEREGQLTWTGNLAMGERTTFPLPELADLEGIYDFKVSIELPSGVSDERPLNNRLTKRNLSILNPAPLDLSIVGEDLGSPCSHTNVVLKLEAENVVEINWYIQSIGGLPLGTGPTYTTPALPAPFTFYVDPTFEAHGGLLEKDNANSQLSTDEQGLLFDVYDDILLKSVKLYNETTGPQQIVIQNAEGATIFNEIFNITSTGAFTADLNVELSRADAYRIFLNNSTGLYFNTTADYPYRMGHVMSIRSSTDENNLDNRYYYFYDWVIEHHYICGRQPIRIDYVPTDTPPNAAFTPSTNLVNVDNPGPVSFSNESEDAVQYWWEFGDGTSSSEENPIHTYATSGIFLVSLTAVNAAGCSETVSTEIEVEEEALSNKEIEWQNQILVFPNPNNGMVQIQLELENAKEVKVYLVDLLGRQLDLRSLSAATANDFQWNLSAYPEGMYHFVFDIDGQKVVKKIVKMD